MPELAKRTAAALATQDPEFIKVQTEGTPGHISDLNPVSISAGF
jgi:hypothetical protein